VEEAKIPHGSWVVGDSWFGSVMMEVEMMKRRGVHLTWII